MSTANERFLQRMMMGDAFEGLHGLTLDEVDSKPAYKLSDYVMVAAIDFGTTFSGYAFSFKTEKDKIKMNKNWGAEAGFTSYKTPTCLVMDNKKKFKAFGYEAQQLYSEMMEKEEQDFYYFERFKMRLHNTKNLGKETKLTASNGKTIPALRVFSMALRYLKVHLITEVKKSLTSGIEDKMIRWVITVPAIWSNASKQFMREAALQGGLINEVDSGQLVIALEPEAASLFVRSLDINHFNRGEDNNIRPGTKYMVLDAGGGTLDVTVHEVLENDKVKEIHYATGGALGGTKVEEEFVKLMEKIFEKSFIEEFKKDCPAQWLTMLMEFERKKRMPMKRKSVNIQMPWLFGMKYNESKRKGIDVVIKGCGIKGVKFGNGVLIFDFELVKKLFEPAISGIVSHIKEIMKKPELQGVEYFFCVGGFNESTLLQSALDENFGSDVKLILPAEASLAILKGAVQFGHAPDSISSRVSAKTYGVDSMEQFVPYIHDHSKAVMVQDMAMCRDIFEIFVSKGEEIASGYSKTVEFSPMLAEQDGASIHIFSVDRPGVKYITDEGVEYHGQIFVHWPGRGLHRKLKVTMTIGGPEIRVSAVTYPGECSADTTINFLSK